jgi:uncharacterized protein (DUF1800 family)
MHPSRHPRRRRPPAGAWAAPAVLLLLAACGGAPGEPGTGDGTVAPANLVYSASPVMYRTDTPITPNVPVADGDPVTSWSISPALPGGLTFDAGSGEITGMPVASSPAADYMVTATNGGGATQAAVNIEVQWHESKSLAPKPSITDEDVRHFLDRTHFGFSQAHYDLIQSLGLAAYVDAMTTFADTTQLETDAKNIYFIDPANDPNGDFPNENDLARWWLYITMLNPNPFQENLALHWHEHFAASSNVLTNASYHFFVDYINLFRHDGAGNLRSLLLNMALDSAMLVYLDGILNRDGNINENFGREWFELFAVGVDIDYTQQDIVEASRAFTGFRLRTDQGTGKSFTEFDFNRHDDEEKTILGVTIPAQVNGAGEVHEYDQVVDITLNHAEAGTGVSRTGQWIVRSLLRYFCYPDPPQNVVDELAGDLRDGGWEIKPILIKLFLSEAFFSAKAREGIVKGPVEHVAGFMRATNLLGNPAVIDNALRLMGHRPTQPPTVDGWPGGTQWLSAQGMVDRANLLNYLTEQAEPLQGELNIFALALLPAPDAAAGPTVDALAQRLDIPLTPAERTECVTYLDTERDEGGNVTPDPFDPVNNTRDAESRVRGLLWILGQHPQYQVR